MNISHDAPCGESSTMREEQYHKHSRHLSLKYLQPAWINSERVVKYNLMKLQATAAVLVYTSYRVCGLLSAMPKKPSDDKALYTYAG